MPLWLEHASGKNGISLTSRIQPEPNPSDLSHLCYADKKHAQYKVIVKLLGSFRLTALNRHLHRYCIFTELVPETVFQSLHHSCASELQIVILSYERDQTISSSLKILREPACYNFILFHFRKSYLHCSSRTNSVVTGSIAPFLIDATTSHGIPLCALFCKGLHRYKPDLIRKSLSEWAVSYPTRYFALLYLRRTLSSS